MLGLKATKPGGTYDSDFYFFLIDVVDIVYVDMYCVLQEHKKWGETTNVLLVVLITSVDVHPY